MSGSEFSGFPNLRITRVMKDGKGSRDFWVEQSPGLQRVVHDHDQYILPMPWLYFRVQAFGHGLEQPCVVVPGVRTGLRG